MTTMHCGLERSHVRCLRLNVSTTDGLESGKGVSVSSGSNRAPIVMAGLFFVGICQPHDALIPQATAQTLPRLRVHCLTRGPAGTCTITSLDRREITINRALFNEKVDEKYCITVEPKTLHMGEQAFYNYPVFNCGVPVELDLDTNLGAVHFDIE